LNVTFNTTREGSDAAAIQAQLKQALDAALAEAKKAARPGQVDVQTGNFTLSPRYTNKGVISGWQGSAELIVEGRDMQAIGQLSGRITTLTINRVGYALSRELREKSEGEVSAQAIARYRAKAADYAKQFGYSGYTLREVNVSSNEQPPIPRPMQMRAQAMAAPSDDALPIEPGKGTVTVNVNGTVQMVK
jgi:predicted secreted protein